MDANASAAVKNVDIDSTAIECVRAYCVPGTNPALTDLVYGKMRPRVFGDTSP